MRQDFQLPADGDLVLQRLHQTCPTDWKVTVTVDEKNSTPFWKVSTAFVHFQKPELLGSDDLHGSQCVNIGWCSPILALVYFSSNTHSFQS